MRTASGKRQVVVTENEEATDNASLVVRQVQRELLRHQLKGRGEIRPPGLGRAHRAAGLQVLQSKEAKILRAT